MEWIVVGMWANVNEETGELVAPPDAELEILARFGSMERALEEAARAEVEGVVLGVTVTTKELWEAQRSTTERYRVSGELPGRCVHVEGLTGADCGECLSR